MNILSIGNSFSQDAQRYLSRIAKADGEKLQSFNLYIGGCSLARHYRNMLSGEREYELEMNGTNTRFKVSLEEALLNRDWDIVTVQQVSKQANDYESYQPYLNELVDFVRRCVPGAKIAFHQTWAYEQDSQKLEMMGYPRWEQMIEDIIPAAARAAKDVDADFLIPSGEVFRALLEKGVEKVHRDTFHASLGLGRYALGLTWYRFLTGRDVADNTFADFDAEVTPEQVSLAKQCVAQVAQKYGK